MIKGHYIVSLALAICSIGCSRGPQTGPVDIRWDREVCERCSMSIGDRLFAAEVRGWPSESDSEVYKFDDLGCAVIWLEAQAWKNDNRVEVWVTDHRDGSWLDARQASYVGDLITPMDYGLGAQADRDDGVMSFEMAVAHIRGDGIRKGIHDAGDPEHKRDGRR